MSNQVEELSDRLSAGYDPSLFLGRLSWYSIDDSIVISKDDFNAKIQKAGIKFPELPKIHKSDVWKRGCTDAKQSKYVPTLQEARDLKLPDGAYLNHLFRRVGAHKGEIWRILIRETVDSQGKELGYEEVAKLTYNIQDNTWKVVLTSHNVLPTEHAIIQSVETYFNNNAVRATPYSIREWVRKNLEWYLHSIKVRPSGGVYFVQEQYSETLLALEDVLTEIGAAFHTLPLLDDSKQREMLRAAFEEESVADISIMMDEMKDILQGDKDISSDLYAEFHVRYDKMRKKVLEYSDILDEAMEKTASYLEIAKVQISKLADKVDA